MRTKSRKDIPSFRLCPGRFLNKNHWPGKHPMWGISHRPETPCRTCVFLGDAKPWLGVTRSVKSTGKHLKAWKKLEVSSAYLSNKDCNYSDYDGFQMEEGGIRFFFGMCHGHFSWLLCGWNHDCFQTANWSTRWDLGEAQSPVVSPLIGDSLEWLINPSQDSYAY